MIKAEFNVLEDGSSLVMTVKGHAGQNDIGKDIICSAASILSFTLAQVVNEMYKSGQLRKKPTVKLKEGDATIVAKPLASTKELLSHSFYVAETGYKLLAHNYPEYVRINGFNWE